MAYKDTLKSKTNRGRTMLEMLAVLAIMAVLAFGVATGLRYALDKNAANNVAKEAMRQAVELKNRRHAYTKSDGEIRYNYDSEYITSRKYQDDTKKVILLKAANIKKGVCEKVIESQKSNDFFTSVLVDGTTETCTASNTVVFAFDVIAQKARIPVIVDPCKYVRKTTDCRITEDQKDEKGCVTTMAVNCPSDSYCDDNGNCIACPENSSTTTSGDETSTAKCYCNADYPYWHNSSCNQCTEEKIYYNNAGCCTKADDSAACCTAINGNTYDYIDGACVNCPTGTIYVEGKCLNFHCDASSNATCRINGIICGVECNGDGSNCKYGVCKREECTPEQTFEMLKYYWIGIGNTRYGCKINASENVYRMTNVASAGYQKYYDSSFPVACCNTDQDNPSECYQYICDPDVCTQVGGSFKPEHFGGILFGGGCQFSTGEWCTLQDKNTGSWWCFNSVPQLCGSGTLEDARSQCSADCLDGGTLTEDGYCLYTVNGINLYAKSDGMFRKINFEYIRCGTGSIQALSGWTLWGNCLDPGCASTNPLFSHSAISGDDFAGIMGCVSQQKGIQCLRDGITVGNDVYTCLDLSGSLCGRNCTMDGLCNEAVQLACVRNGYCTQTGQLIENCICEGYNSNGYCCPTGHIYVNGSCQIVQCSTNQCLFNSYCIAKTDAYTANVSGICECVETDKCLDNQRICQTVTQTLIKDNNGRCQSTEL